MCVPIYMWFRVKTYVFTCTCTIISIVCVQELRGSITTKFRWIYLRGTSIEFLNNELQCTPFFAA